MSVTTAAASFVLSAANGISLVSLLSLRHYQLLAIFNYTLPSFTQTGIRKIHSNCTFRTLKQTEDFGKICEIRHLELNLDTEPSVLFAGQSD